MTQGMSTCTIRSKFLLALIFDFSPTLTYHNAKQYSKSDFLKEKNTIYYHVKCIQSMSE
jgi:hypothetical protein